ncbi:hypothetical protein V8G54_024596 [Vigna mungo]|uniref:Uncharacterized protein n=1 Tax=Vigna mungo TaxID=3915 RepID=A0AAQ3N7C7_VIGMU
MFLCLNEDVISISRENSFQASFDVCNTLTATGFPSGRTPLYTQLLPPFPTKFSEENCLVQDCRSSRLNQSQSIEFTHCISSRPFGSSTDGAEENLELSSSISLMLLSNGLSSEEEEQGLLDGERSGKVITHCTTDMSLA